jgi:hypothetical protein
MIEEVFIPLVAAGSTVIAGWFAARRLGWPLRSLGPGVGRALECVGAVVLFCVLNAVVGAAVIFAARALSGRFVSLHLGADQSLLGISALQALVFQWWRESSRRGGGPSRE